MHKLESFALSSGSKIEKPFIEQCFFPILEKKFICISQKSESESKKYDFFDDVIFHIKPFLERNGISIVEIGSNKSRPTFYSKTYSNLTTLQSSYLINKSILYLGNYNLHANIAAHFNKKVIFPSNNDFTETFKPYWSKKDLCSIITPDLKIKPTFQNEESPKTINKINPEDVACEVLDLLEIPHNLQNIRTVFLGELYKDPIIDLIPEEFNVNAMNISGPVNIRFDKVFNPQFLNLCESLKLINIITDKVIPVEYIKNIINNINSITFFVNSKTTEDEMNIMQSIGKPLVLLCKESKNIDKLRLKFIDYPIKLFTTLTKKDLNQPVLSDLKFLSKKNIISKGNVFNSYLSLSLNKNVSSITNSKEVWEDLPYFRIFREKA
jgi:hypothetical protein